MKVIICENCYNIPKITILNNSKVRLECEKCNQTKIKNRDYFDKFINDNINTNLFDLDNCNYVNHEEEKRATIYCFQCEKYICNDCLENIHNISHRQRHSTIKQKVLNNYYCKELGHEEYILERYCTKCKKYLCSKCKCNHKNRDIFNFENQENKINEIKEKIKKCEEVIRIEENYLNKYIKTIQDKIEKLKNLFKDYKNRNLNAISIYKLLIDNYEQNFNKIRNYNIYNNININDNFNLNESTVYSNECLNSIYNRLSAFYMNTNHIKSEKYTDYYITEKWCDKHLKKCIIINQNIIAYIYEEKLKNISFAYKLKDDSPYMKFDIFFEEFIQDIYRLDKDKIIYFDYSNNLYINEIYIKDNTLKGNKIQTFKNINNCFIDLYSDNRFFMIENNEQFFKLTYCKDNKYENINIISKENKKYNNEYIINDIRELIEKSNLNNREIIELKSIFVYNGQNDKKFEKLINMNKKLLKFFDDKNKDLYNKLKNKINDNEDKYMFNSNYIYKTFQRINNNLDNYNLNLEEKEEIKYILDLKDLCCEILELYTNYIIFNSKINKVYNYKNNFIFFIGENYLINIYSLKKKKFYNLASINMILNVEDYNNFEIIKITSDKIIFNDSKNKTIYFIENNNKYNCCLLKKTIKYYSSIAIDNNYLLHDKIENDKLEFSFINLTNLENKENNDLIELLNFKINYNIPKIILTQEFKKIISIYDNNQLSIADYKYNNIYNNENNLIINEINLIQDNNSEIVPPSSSYFSAYDDEYTPNKLFIENDYYCSKSNGNNENIMFDFEKEYWFNKVIVEYVDKYKTSRIKNLNVLIYDNKKRFIDKFVYNNINQDLNSFNFALNSKCRYIKFEFIENYGGDYFIIGKIRFNTEEIYSIN